MALGVSLKCPLPWEDFSLSVVSAVWLTYPAEALWFQALQHIDDGSIRMWRKDISLHRGPKKGEITDTSCNLKNARVLRFIG